MARKRSTASRAKRVWAVDYASLGRGRLERTMLAEFTLDRRGQLSTTWHDPRFGREIEKHGIVAPPGVVLRPQDGERFFDGLSWAYAHSTVVHVEDVTPAACIEKRR